MHGDPTETSLGLGDTYLLTYNPKIWTWDDHEDFLETVRTEGVFEGQWSTGRRTQRIGPGDRVFLLRQGIEPRGIIASGEVVSTVYQEANWRADGTQWLANYVDIDWDAAVPLDAPLPLDALFAAAPDAPKKVWEPQSGGTLLAEEHAPAAWRLWSE